MTSCSSCHNVHGAVGLEGSTNEPMVRDGSLAGRPGGYGFSYVIEDAAQYPWVTSSGATQASSVGAILRYNTGVNNMCGGTMCHGNPVPPPGATYDASGSSWGTYLEYYRPWGPYDRGGLGTEKGSVLVSGPNPVRQCATIGLSISTRGDARLRVFGIGGELIRTLRADNLSPGKHDLVWDLMDRHGRRVSPGVYFYSIEMEQTELIGGKLIVLR